MECRGLGVVVHRDHSVVVESLAVPSPLHEGFGALHRLELELGRAVKPTPGLEHLAAFSEDALFGCVSWQLAAVALVRHDLAADAGLLLVDVGVRLVAGAAGVRKAEAEVIEAWDREVHVHVWELAAIAAWRAAILLHHDGGPILVDRVRIPHQQTLPAATSSLIVDAAELAVGAEHVTERIRGCARHPDLLAVLGAPVLFRIQWGVVRCILVFAGPERLQHHSITSGAVAIPEMCAREPLMPPTGRRWTTAGWRLRPGRPSTSMGVDHLAGPMRIMVVTNFAVVLAGLKTLSPMHVLLEAGEPGIFAATEVPTILLLGGAIWVVRRDQLATPGGLELRWIVHVDTRRALAPAAGPAHILLEALLAAVAALTRVRAVLMVESTVAGIPHLRPDDAPARA